MNKIVTTALGLAAVGSVGFADPGDSDWLKLDSEINGLATSLATRDGSGTTALLRFAGLHGSDDISTGAGAPNGDLSGFDLFDVDVAHHGGVGEFLYRISVDFDGGGADLEDGYIYFPCGPVNARAGRFKPSVIRSANIRPENQLFFNRTIIGSAFDFWNEGVEISGEQEGLAWAFAIQNGSNGAFADHFYALMVSYAIGAGAGSSEGARGGNDDLNATIDLTAITDDTQSGDQMSFLLGLNGNQGQIGFGLELAQIDDDAFGWMVNSDFAGVLDPSSVSFDGDSTPYAATVSYLLNPDVEIGLRYEDADNSDDVTLLTVGASFYQSGNNAKYQVAYTDVSSDADEGSFVTLGLVVGASD